VRVSRDPQRMLPACLAGPPAASPGPSRPARHQRRAAGLSQTARAPQGRVSLYPKLSQAARAPHTRERDAEEVGGAAAGRGRQQAAARRQRHAADAGRRQAARQPVQVHRAARPPAAAAAAAARRCRAHLWRARRTA